MATEDIVGGSLKAFTVTSKVELAVSAGSGSPLSDTVSVIVLTPVDEPTG